MNIEDLGNLPAAIGLEGAAQPLAGLGDECRLARFNARCIQRDQRVNMVDAERHRGRAAQQYGAG